MQVRERISIELALSAHHLVPLPSDQQLVQEQRVGVGERSKLLAGVLEIWLRRRKKITIK